MDLKKIKPTKKEYYIIIGLLAFFAALFFFSFYTPNYFESEGKVFIQVEKGMTLDDVLEILEEKEIIDVKEPLKLVAYIYNVDEQLKTGRYEIRNGFTYMELIKAFKHGVPREQVKVTFPEGLYLHEIASILQKKTDVDSAKFMQMATSSSYVRKIGLDYANSLQGYMLPNTYYLYKDSSPQRVIRKLVNEVKKIFNDQAIKTRMDSLNMTEHEVLTLASIIEGETSLKRELKTVSGVYHNRLRIGMPLQADPTIQYMIRFKNRNRVLYRDLEIDSPYNTYKRKGLPPGPINNPGKEAIIAALYPEKHKFLYFVADGTGGHKFARTHEEHLRNVREYRKWRNSQ